MEERRLLADGLEVLQHVLGHGHGSGVGARVLLESGLQCKRRYVFVIHLEQEENVVQRYEQSSYNTNKS